MELLLIIAAIGILFLAWKGWESMSQGKPKPEIIKEKEIVYVEAAEKDEAGEFFFEEPTLKAELFCQYKDEIKVLNANPKSSDSFGVFEGQPLILKWETEYAEAVFFEENGIRQRVTDKGEKKLLFSKSTHFSLIVQNSNTEIRRSIQIHVFPVAKIRNIILPLPKRIDFQTEFSFSLVTTPSAFHYGDANFNALLHIPKLEDIKSKIYDNAPSTSKMIEQMGVSSIQLQYKKDRYSTFKKVIFDKLETQFAKDEKKLDILKTIRKHYE